MARERDSDEPISTPSEADRFLAQQLFYWYRRHGRDLPWRNDRSPYHIWVSEIILQQTQVSRAIDYYKRFLKRFPSLKALAEAEWDDVYEVWRGLGYYSRARNALEAARIVREDFSGRFPRDQKTLQSLPGVGEYTASAIVCFAFGESVPALDTNLNRVLQRYYGCPEKGVEPRAKVLFQRRRGTGADLNYALMDLGASLCRARKVRCEECPLQKKCDFFLSGRGESLVEKEIKSDQGKVKGKPVVDVGIACIHQEGKYLIGKRPESKGGLWEFPGGKREKGESIRACLKREVQEELGVEVSVRPAFLVVAQEDAGYIWKLHFCRCQIQRGILRCMLHEELNWVTPEEIGEIPFPQANSEAVAYLKSLAGR